MNVLPCPLIRCVVPLTVALLAGHTAFGQANPPVSKPPPCAGAEHRQFDFWLGDWEVSDPAGKRVGHNRIEAAHGGCALIEHWTSVAGVTGTSVNLYDRDRGRCPPLSTRLSVRKFKRLRRASSAKVSPSRAISRRKLAA